MGGEPLVKMEGITKYFGGIRALEEVNFTLNYNEVVGLVGDNGAGKSTLIKILAGVYKADRGEIFFEGRRVQIESPAFAKSLGIETVHQDRGLVGSFDVASNIFLGRELTQLGLLDLRRMRRESQALLDRLGIQINSIKAITYNLSGGQQQAVAVARALYTDPKVIILDEPTASLAVAEAGKVLSLIPQLKERGVSVIFISHTLQEIFAVSDRIVILRSGRKVADKKTSETNMEEVVKLMVGRR
jgi:ABC-type sugar transport system ATPase subunit